MNKHANSALLDLLKVSKLWHAVCQLSMSSNPDLRFHKELCFFFFTVILFHCHEQISFARSNTSVAFPYVSTSEDVLLENSLVSGFAEACGDMGIGNVAFHGSCSIDDANHEEITTLHSVQVINKLMWHGPLWNFGSCMVTWCSLFTIDRTIWPRGWKRVTEGKLIWLCSAMKALKLLRMLTGHNLKVHILLCVGFARYDFTTC